MLTNRFVSKSWLKYDKKLGKLKCKKLYFKCSNPKERKSIQKTASQFKTSKQNHLNFHKNAKIKR